jgi:hypothetical protein
MLRALSEATDSGAGPRWFFANLAEVKLTPQASGDQMSIVEISSPPGDMPPLHVHRTDEEAWVVLEGEVSLFAGSNDGPGKGWRSLTWAWRIRIASNRMHRRGCSRFAHQATFAAL